MMKIHKFKFDQFKFCNNNMQIYYANIPHGISFDICN